MDDRQIRGIGIITKGDTPKVVGDETFIVPSQSDSEVKYTVMHRQAWSCTCPDYQTRKTVCKHIHSVMFWLKLRGRLHDDTLELEQELTHANACPHCKSVNIVSNGRRNTKIGVTQRYLCKDCKKRFVLEPIKKVKVNPKMIALTMDLYFKGLSLRDISDTIMQFYNIKVSHETIRLWINKFTKKMNDYVKKQQIKKVSPKWKADEQMVKAGGDWFWSWNIIDPQTKYLLASNLTETRKTEDAVKALHQASEWTKTRPQEIVTDGAFAYGHAIKKAYPGWWRKEGRMKHSRYRTIRDKAKNNNDIERYHGTFREFDKVRRGFERQHTAQANIDGFRTFYNYIRTHTELNMTPAEAAGIDLQLGRNKWLGLLMKSIMG